METMKKITATLLKAKCLQTIRQAGRDLVPVTITRRGRPAALLSPLPNAGKPASIIGAMQGSVLSYEAPFEPAFEPSNWAIFRC